MFMYLRRYLCNINLKLIDELVYITLLTDLHKALQTKNVSTEKNISEKKRI